MADPLPGTADDGPESNEVTQYFYAEWISVLRLIENVEELLFHFSHVCLAESVDVAHESRESLAGEFVAEMHQNM